MPCRGRVFFFGRSLAAVFVVVDDDDVSFTWTKQNVLNIFDTEEKCRVSSSDSLVEW